MKSLFLSLISLSLTAQVAVPVVPQGAAQAVVSAEQPADKAKPPAPPKRPWSNVTTLSYVATAGNAEGQTIGFGNDFLYKWSQSAFSLKVSAIRVNSTVVTRSATGTSLADYSLGEQHIATTTAEAYSVNGRFDHRLKDKDRWYWFGGAGWERNRPAGLDNKFTSQAGFGRIWADLDRSRFRTDAGFGYTYEQPLVPPVGFRASYNTVNFTSQLKQKVGASSLYTVDLALTDNLSDSPDCIGVLRQGLTVSINKTMALKIGYDLAYKNRPNLIPVDIFTEAAPPVSLGKISVLAKRTDTTFTTSLVITL